MIVKSVAFDLDGTLVDSASLVGEILNSMRLEKGLSPLGGDCYRIWSSRGGPHLVGNALEVAPEASGAFVEEFRRRYYQLPTPADCVFPGAWEMLNQLKNAGCLLAICSNKPQRLCHKVLSETGLIHFFGAIVGGDTLDKSKPDPTPLKYALSRLGNPLEAALMVGDSVVDQQTAMAAGVKFAFFTGGYDDGVDRLEASHVIDTLDELAPVVGLQRQETKQSLRPQKCFHYDRGAVEQSKSAY
jgi:phosphoglycolate phosphatase